MQSGPIPMKPRTLPERFIVKGGVVRSTHDTFSEGDCLTYVERNQWGFLVPTGKFDRDDAPVFDDFIVFPTRDAAGEWVTKRNAVASVETREPEAPSKAAAPRG